MARAPNPEPPAAGSPEPQISTRRLAELIWESENRPDGRAVQHWLLAQSILANLRLSGDTKLSDVDKLQFESDSAEVQLLLDFISGNPNFGFTRTAHPPSGAIDQPPPPGPANQADALLQAITNSQITAAELVQVSTIRFPPDKTPIANAIDAAFLIAFRDKLNQLVAPASGLTVAFTLRIWTPFPWAFWETWECWKKRHPKSANPNSEWARWNLAKQAYPRLEHSILWFRISTILLPVLAFVVIIASIWFSQVVAEGQARLDRVTTLEQQRDTLTASLEQQANVAPEPGSPKAAIGYSDEGGANIAEPTLADFYCLSAQSSPPALQNGTLNITSPGFAEKYETCYEIWTVQAELTVAQSELLDWWRQLDTLRAKRLLALFPEPKKPAKPSAAATVAASMAITPAQAAANITLPISRLAEITSIWGPALYGFIGAIVAALRSIYTKVSSSTLAPWDTRLMWTRVLLGAMAGTFIGLFFSPSGTSVAGVPGIGSLSLSAIAFLAGYAVDKLFGLLDEIIGRIFGTSKPGTTNTQITNTNITTTKK
jgi:hypothetical protein